MNRLGEKGKKSPAAGRSFPGERAARSLSCCVQNGKEQSETDKREYHLVVTQKYIDYYNISYGYLSTVMDRIKDRFPAEDVAKIEEMLDIISDELMPEIPLPKHT